MLFRAKVATGKRMLIQVNATAAAFLIVHIRLVVEGEPAGRPQPNKTLYHDWDRSLNVQGSRKGDRPDVAPPDYRL